jgi:hypothetical protein
MSDRIKHEGYEYDIDYDWSNGEAEIWRVDMVTGDYSLIDRIDLTDLLAGYANNSKSRVQDAIEQNARQYQTAKHKWFEEDQ